METYKIDLPSTTTPPPPSPPPPLAQEDIKGTCSVLLQEIKEFWSSSQIGSTFNSVVRNAAQLCTRGFIVPLQVILPLSASCAKLTFARFVAIVAAAIFLYIFSFCIHFIQQKELLLTEVHFIAESGQSPTSRTTRYTLVLGTATMV